MSTGGRVARLKRRAVGEVDGKAVQAGAARRVDLRVAGHDIGELASWWSRRAPSPSRVVLRPRLVGRREEEREGERDRRRPSRSGASGGRRGRARRARRGSRARPRPREARARSASRAAARANARGRCQPIASGASGASVVSRVDGVQRLHRCRCGRRCRAASPRSGALRDVGDERRAGRRRAEIAVAVENLHRLPRRGRGAASSRRRAVAVRPVAPCRPCRRWRSACRRTRRRAAGSTSADRR